MHTACYEGRYSYVAAKLLSSFTKYTRRNGQGRTLLHEACRGGHADVVKLLLTHRTFDVNATDKTHQVPLGYAIEGEHVQTVDVLLEHKACLSYVNDITLRRIYDNMDYIPILSKHGLLEYRHLAWVTRQQQLDLLPYFNPEFAKRYDLTEIIKDCDSAEMVRFFINLKCSFRYNAVIGYMLRYWRKIGAVIELLNHTAEGPICLSDRDFNQICEASRFDALEVAFKMGVRLTRYMIRVLADFDVPSSLLQAVVPMVSKPSFHGPELPDGTTLLQTIALTGSHRITKWLVKTVQVDVGRRNHHGQTPLDMVVGTRYVEWCKPGATLNDIAKTLIVYGSPVDSQKPLAVRRFYEEYRNRVYWDWIRLRTPALFDRLYAPLLGRIQSFMFLV